MTTPKDKPDMGPIEVTTTAGISREMVRDLKAESIEARLGLVDRIPHRIEWLSHNGSP